MGVVTDVGWVLQPLRILFGLLVHLNSFISKGIVRILVLNMSQSLPVLELQSKPLQSFLSNLLGILVTPERLEGSDLLSFLNRYSLNIRLRINKNAVICI